MDGSRFDSLARTLATPISRRSAIRVLLGAVAAGIAAGRGSVAAVDAGQADAARRRPFWHRGSPCSTNDQCGRLVPCTNGICTAIKCDIDGQEWDAGPKPGNECQYCLPEREPGIPDAWSTRPFGSSCFTVTGETASDRVCRGSAYCNLDGVCTPGPQPKPVGTLCGPSKTCCGNVCCAATECCNAAGACEECGPHCVIDYVPHLAGAGHPDGSCQICDPADFSFWTTAPDTFACGPNRDQACCRGVCCDPGECCGPTGQCEPCEPACEVTGSWCGPDNNQICCSGECCPYGQYCGSPDSCACCPSGERCDGGVCEPL